MKAALTVTKSGVHSTVQDLGRPGLRSYGVPGSGALDTVALRLANLLVGNPEGLAGIEMLYGGGTFEVTSGRAHIAIGGADTLIVSGNRESRPLPAWHSTVVYAGDRVRVGAVKTSAAAYFAVEGGFDLPPVLGSLSTSVRACIGVRGGRALRNGDALPLKLAEPGENRARRFDRAPLLEPPAVLRVMPGPHEEWFTAGACDALLREAFTVSQTSDRSGLRLAGTVLQHRAGYDLLSEGIPPGSIQVPGSGEPILLIADHPTVGGYPRIATVISADLPAAGRLRIGAAVRFAAVDEHTAARARSEQRAWFADLAASVRDSG
jgi:biotin-dependent carboxylase-like uncharacterized protein